MKSLLLTTALILTPVLGQAQTTQTMDHTGATMNHDTMMQMSETDTSAMPATEPGQGAFAALAEIVAALEANPMTDWSKVDISGLREHLRDMDVVMIDASAQAEEISGGIRFTVTGDANVSPSIERMVLAHAGIMQGVNDWQYEASAIDGGAVVTVMVPAEDQAKINALGFFGMLTSGMHHQEHHWMMATGGNPHG